MAEQEESKSQIVKRLAVIGKFSEVESRFGPKAAARAREYVDNKLTKYRENPQEDRQQISAFMRFSLQFIHEDLNVLAARFHEHGNTAPGSATMQYSVDVCTTAPELATEPVTASVVVPGAAVPALVVDSSVIPGTAVSPETKEVRERHSDPLTDEGASSDALVSNGSISASYAALPQVEMADGSATVLSKPRKSAKEKNKKAKSKGKLKKDNHSASSGTAVNSSNSRDAGARGSATSNRASNDLAPFNAAALSDKEFEILINKPLKKRKPHVVASSSALVQETKVGVKQNELPMHEDLQSMVPMPLRPGNFPVDVIASQSSIGKKYVLVLPAYRDFISRIPSELLGSSGLFQEVQEVCSLTEKDIVILTLKGVDAVPLTQDAVDNAPFVLQFVTDISDSNNSQCPTHKYVKCLYVPTSSKLLTTDRFILSLDEYSLSLKKPILVVNAPVRKLYSLDETSATNLCGGWEEGTIYHINEDFCSNPYQSVSVIWSVQEKDSNKWVYQYSQTNNIVSPWDLELSEFALAENLRPRTLPRALTVGVPTPTSVLLYITSLDGANNFKLSMADNEEFCAQFPREEDQLDLLLLTQLGEQGRYADGNGLGLALLFSDLNLMIRNCKAYNSDNAMFLPWRLCDVLEKTVIWLKRELSVRTMVKRGTPKKFKATSLPISVDDCLGTQPGFKSSSTRTDNPPGNMDTNGTSCITVTPPRAITVVDVGCAKVGGSAQNLGSAAFSAPQVALSFHSKSQMSGSQPHEKLQSQNRLSGNTQRVFGQVGSSSNSVPCGFGTPSQLLSSSCVNAAKSGTPKINTENECSALLMQSQPMDI